MDAPVFDDESIDSEEVKTAAVGSKKSEAKTDPQCFIGLGNNPRLAKEALT
jgi:hypothetical protein